MAEDTQVTTTNVAERIKIICNKFKITKKQMAQDLGYSLSAVTKVCVNNYMPLKMAKKIAYTFSLPEKWVIDGTYDGDDSIFTNEEYKIKSNKYNLQMRLTPFDNNSNDAIITIDPKKEEFTTNGFYLMQLPDDDIYRVYYVTIIPPEKIKLSSVDDEFIISRHEFNKIKIIGFVVSMTKNF
jgi:DNA-binding XRE family transcriptional regulator